jgi:hypothetical protein
MVLQLFSWDLTSVFLKAKNASEGRFCEILFYKMKLALHSRMRHSRDMR